MSMEVSPRRHPADRAGSVRATGTTNYHRRNNLAHQFPCCAATSEVLGRRGPTGALGMRPIREHVGSWGLLRVLSGRWRRGRAERSAYGVVISWLAFGYPF